MTKAVLAEADLPTYWYNLAADPPVPASPSRPVTWRRCSRRR
jgi:predicted alternative tryptophan synthase beta-subunit